MHSSLRTSRVLTLPLLVLLPAAAAAQSGGADAAELQPYEFAGHFRLIAATGEIIPEPLDGGPQAPLDCGDFVVNALTNLDAGSGYLASFVMEDDEYVDWGVVSREATSDIITEFRIGYATLELDPSIGGPGARVELAFYEGYEGPCEVGQAGSATELASFEFTGLPGYVGGPYAAGYFVTVDLRGGLEFELPEGAFGFGQRRKANVSGNLTGLIQSFAGDPAGSQDQPDENGQVTALDAFVPDAVSGTCISSGPVVSDASGIPLGSHYLLLRKVNAEAADPADAFVRNDAGGSNPLALLPAGTPILGGDLTLVAAATGPAEAGVFLSAWNTPAEVATRFGVLLVDVTDPGGDAFAAVGLSGPHAYSGGFVAVSAPLPPNVELCGRSLFVQAAQFGTRLQLTNAVDLTFGVY